MGAAIQDRHTEFVAGPLRRASGRDATGDAQNWPVVVGWRTRFDPQPPDVPLAGTHRVVARAQLTELPVASAHDQFSADALLLTTDARQDDGQIPRTHASTDRAGSAAASAADEAGAQSAPTVSPVASVPTAASAAIASIVARDGAQPAHAPDPVAPIGRRAIDRVASATASEQPESPQVHAAPQQAARKPDVRADQSVAGDLTDATALQRSISTGHVHGESVQQHAGEGSASVRDAMVPQSRTPLVPSGSLTIGEPSARGSVESRAQVTNALTSVTMRMPMAASVASGTHEIATPRPSTMLTTASRQPLPGVMHGVIHRERGRRGTLEQPLASPMRVASHNPSLNLKGASSASTSATRTVWPAVNEAVRERIASRVQTDAAAARTASNVVGEAVLARTASRIPSDVAPVRTERAIDRATREAVAMWPTANTMQRASVYGSVSRAASALPERRRLAVDHHTLLAPAPIVSAPSQPAREWAGAPARETAASSHNPADARTQVAAAVLHADANNPSRAEASSEAHRPHEPHEPVATLPVARLTDVNARAIVNLLRGSSERRSLQRDPAIESDAKVLADAPAVAEPSSHLPIKPIPPNHAGRETAGSRTASLSGAAGPGEAATLARVVARTATPPSAPWSASTAAAGTLESGPQPRPTSTNEVVPGSTAVSSDPQWIAKPLTQPSGMMFHHDFPTSMHTSVERQADFTHEPGGRGQPPSYDFSPPSIDERSTASVRGAPVARSPYVHRVFTPSGSWAMRATGARAVQRSPLPLLPAYGAPARHAAAASPTGSDPSTPPVAIDRLAEQYGVIPVDTQKTAARPAGATAPAQTAPAPAAQKTADPNELAEKVWEVIQDKLAVERERRGYASWP